MYTTWMNLERTVLTEKNNTKMLYFCMYIWFHLYNIPEMKKVIEIANIIGYKGLGIGERGSK